MWEPAKPRKAGSNVIAAKIITATPMAADRPSVCTNGIGTTSRPSNATHTVMPANSAALPAVCIASPTDSIGSRPSEMNCR